MRRGRIPKRHDCGHHGLLTAREISAISGVCESAIHQRIRNGVSGEALADPKSTTRPRGEAYTVRDAGVPATTGITRVAVAVSICRRFPDAPPTVDLLRREYGMSRATAYRWRAAFVDAMGLQS